MTPSIHSVSQTRRDERAADSRVTDHRSRTDARSKSGGQLDAQPREPCGRQSGRKTTARRRLRPLCGHRSHRTAANTSKRRPTRPSVFGGFLPCSLAFAGNEGIGETGFEPATARPPAGCATRLRHSPWQNKRATGIEPALEAWKASVQPQHFARSPASMLPARIARARLASAIPGAADTRFELTALALPPAGAPPRAPCPPRPPGPVVAMARTSCRGLHPV
jgi:hypothetical protein